MTTAHRFALLVALAALPACSATTTTAAAPSATVAADTIACDAALPVRDDAATWTVEGFDGGGDTQLFSTKRQPVKRCTPAVAQNRGATLDMLR